MRIRAWLVPLVRAGGVGGVRGGRLQLGHGSRLGRRSRPTRTPLRSGDDHDQGDGRGDRGAAVSSDFPPLVSPTSSFTRRSARRGRFAPILIAGFQFEKRIVATRNVASLPILGPVAGQMRLFRSGMSGGFVDPATSRKTTDFAFTGFGDASEGIGCVGSSCICTNDLLAGNAIELTCFRQPLRPTTWNACLREGGSASAIAGSFRSAVRRHYVTGGEPSSKDHVTNPCHDVATANVD